VTGILEPSSALNQVNDQDDDGNYEQEMDQTAANVADEAKKPEDDQDNNYRPKHGYSFWLS
jgi:protoheme ferro-lyase